MTTLNVPITYEGKSVPQLLQAAELSALVPGRIYWITDATLTEGAWVYAITPSAYRIFSPSGKVLQDLRLQGHAVVCDRSDHTICGLIAADELEDRLWVIGTNKLVPTDYDDANRPLELAGSEIMLHGDSIGMLLAGAAIGAPVEVAAVTIDGHAILRAGTVPVPDFVVSDSDAGDYPIPATDTWTQVGILISSIGQAIASGASTTYQLYVQNTGASGGTITVTFEYEDALGNPGVWVPAALSLPHDIAAESEGLLGSAFNTAVDLPQGANIRMLIKASATPTETSLGGFTFYGNTIAAVPSGGFRTNHNKPLSTTQFRISKTDLGDQDAGALLLDLQVGSTFTAHRTTGAATYTVDSVTDQGTAVDVFVSNSAGDDSNWRGDVAFEGTLASGLLSVTIAGSIYPHELKITVPGEGSSSIDALKLRGKDLHSSVANPADGMILVFRTAGDSWVLEAKPAGGASPALGDLTDVVISAATDKELFTYDFATANWINRTPAEAGLAADNHLHAGVYEPADVTLLRQADVDPTPVNGALAYPISSDWAFDHSADIQAHGVSVFGASLTSVADAAGARGVLGVDPAGTNNAPNLNQYELAARLIAGSGEYAGVGAAALVEEPAPAAGHLLLGWVSGALRTFDVDNLPIPVTVLQQSDVDAVPVSGVLTRPISSDWAFDHSADNEAHGVSTFGASLAAAVDAPAARSLLNVDPAGSGQPDISSHVASEDLSAGDLVNLWNDAGTLKVRRANATAAGREIDGYVLAGVLSGAAPVVYTLWGSLITGLSGLTPGTWYYMGLASGTLVPGATVSAFTTGNITQRAGKALDANTLLFQPGEPIEVA